MDTIATAAGPWGALFVGLLLGTACMWALDRWYYLRGGRARIKEAEAKLEELKAAAKAQGVILRESSDK